VDIQSVIKKLTGSGEFFEVTAAEDFERYPAIFKHAPGTLTEIIENARNHGDKEFLISGEKRITFADFFEQVDCLRHAWHERGLGKGDRLAIASRNNPEWLVAFTAGILMGAIVVPINSWGREAELRFALTDCDASWFVCDVERGCTVDDLFEEDHRFVIQESDEGLSCRGTPFNSLMKETKKSLPIDSASPEDLCLIIYTSGSTGAPKGVVHGQCALAQAVFNMMFTGMVSMAVEGPRDLRGGAKQEKTLLTVPLFHGTGLLGSFILPLMTAQAVVFMRKWNAQEALRLIDAERITLFSSVPSLVKDLLSQPNLDHFDIGCLQRVSSGGAAMPADLPELIHTVLDRPSCSGGYGMTETLAVGSQASGAVFDARPKASGFRSPIMQMRCTNPEGEVLPEGEIGEIEMKGVTVTKGYWNKPETSKEVFSTDGWFKSGDLGFLDAAGYLHVTGRIKDIVIRGGENIFPGEVEQALYGLEGIVDCVVFGVPDERLGEELAAVISVKREGGPTERTIREGLADVIAGYKVPKYLVVSSEPLLRGATEKLDKLRIREAFLRDRLAS